MFNADHNDGLKHQLEAFTSHSSEFLQKSALLKGFVNLFQDAGIRVMLQESEMVAMEQGACRWIGVVSYYDHLGKRVEDYVQTHSEHLAGFRDATGVTEVEMFTLPFADPKKCITRVDLKVLEGWNESPVKYGVQPALV